MTTILDKIIKEKQKEVVKLKKQPFNYTDSPYTGPTFAELVQKNKNMSMIAEIKRASSSKGLINGDVDPAHQVKVYEANGASMIALLKDTRFLEGTMYDVKSIRVAVNNRMICKDYMIADIQMDHEKAAGTNNILLIPAAIDLHYMNSLYD